MGRRGLAGLVIMRVLVLGLVLAVVECGPATESYKDQYCTDPRTMHKHGAYTEWADAYSCTRHRCQPGGRNLAIYTVGCKRVEAPESAIECEEVVEDTNMQFPYCCTRLRCLVVVRGEVWTRVLGQPWETLPAAPWSHMYKMKKPPPGDSSFAPKLPDQGPIYELTDSDSDGPREKVLRSSKSASTDSPDCEGPVLRAAPAPAPDIVIALSTNTDPESKPLENIGGTRHKRVHKQVPRAFLDDDRESRDNDAAAMGDGGFIASTEKPDRSDERFYGNGFPATQKAPHQSWTEVPNSWNDHDPGMESDNNRVNPYNQLDFSEHKAEVEKPANLQALVDAIGSRMRDIESVVQRMSEKVHQPGEDDADKGDGGEEDAKRNKPSEGSENGKPKRPGPDQEHYKRFSVRNRGSKYLHTSESTTGNPLFVEDTNMNGYFSDASNSLVRRAGPKEPAQTYMAPVETRRKSFRAAETSDEKKRKKRTHRKKKGKHHKKRNNKKRINRLSSVEVEKNVISLEDSGAVGI